MVEHKGNHPNSYIKKIDLAIEGRYSKLCTERLIEKLLSMGIIIIPSHYTIRNIESTTIIKKGGKTRFIPKAICAPELWFSKISRKSKAKISESITMIEEISDNYEVYEQIKLESPIPINKALIEKNDITKYEVAGVSKCTYNAEDHALLLYRKKIIGALHRFLIYATVSTEDKTKRYYDSSIISVLLKNWVDVNEKFKDTYEMLQDVRHFNIEMIIHLMVMIAKDSTYCYHIFTLDFLNVCDQSEQLEFGIAWNLKKLLDKISLFTLGKEFLLTFLKDKLHADETVITFFYSHG